jgi:hypothetical protein
MSLLKSHPLFNLISGDWYAGVPDILFVKVDIKNLEIPKSAIFKLLFLIRIFLK